MVTKPQKMKRVINSFWSTTTYVATVFKSKFSLWMTYRLKLLVWILSGILEPIFWSLIWYVTAQGSDNLSMSGAEIVTYYLLSALVVRVTRSWSFDTVRREIRLGRYSKYLLWPKSIIFYRLGSDWANRIVTVSVLLPFWLIWLIFTNKFNVLDVNFSNIGLFTISVIMSIALRFLLDLVLAHIALFWKKIDGISQMYWALFRLLGGITVPLMVMPEWVYSTVKFLPFRYIVSFPIEIFQGLADLREIRLGFLLMSGWIGGLIIILILIFKYGLRKYEAVGI